MARFFLKEICRPKQDVIKTQKPNILKMKDRIRAAVINILDVILQRVMDSFQSQLQRCKKKKEASFESGYI